MFTSHSQSRPARYRDPESLKPDLSRASSESFRVVRLRALRCTGCAAFRGHHTAVAYSYLLLWAEAVQTGTTLARHTARLTREGSLLVADEHVTLAYVADLPKISCKGIHQ